MRHLMTMMSRSQPGNLLKALSPRNEQDLPSETTQSKVAAMNFKLATSIDLCGNVKYTSGMFTSALVSMSLTTMFNQSINNSIGS